MWTFSSVEFRQQVYYYLYLSQKRGCEGSTTEEQGIFYNCRALERSIIYSPGPPTLHIHDQGSEFKGEYEKVEEVNGIKVIKSSAYHPQGNGKAEAGVKKVKQKLLTFIENNSNIDGDWDQMPLVKAVHSINTSASTLHGITPMEVIIGRPANEKSILLAKKNLGRSTNQ